MCNGTATQLLCSHYLIHWSGPRCPKQCPLPARRAWLACTCAACDPCHNRSRILDKYATRRELFLFKIRRAMATGLGVQTVRDLEMQLRADARMQMEELAQVGKSKLVGLDPTVACRWPGRYEQWVNGNMGNSEDWTFLLHKK